MKTSLRISLFILALTSIGGAAIEAGGGYVGNGPIQTSIALLNPSFRPQPRFLLAEEVEIINGNYFLLRKNEFEIQTGVFVYQTRDPILRITREGLVPGDGGYNQSENFEWHWNPSLNFAYGISSNITWHGLTNLSFGVINNGGSGYEMAVSVGLTTNGINGQGDYPYLSYFTPGLAINQTWSHERFRVVSSVFSSVVMLNDFEWKFNELGSSAYAFYDVLRKLRLGIGVGGVFYKTLDAGFFKEPELLGPSASATYQLTENFSASGILRFQPQDTAYPQPGIVFSFRW